jgi:hypothetical protein
MPQIQQCILATFAHPQLGDVCECAKPGLYRCVECFNAPMWCYTCIVREHRYNPFHHIEQWGGKMFVRDALATQRPFDKTTSPPTDLSHLHILVSTHLRTHQPHPFCPQHNPSEPTIARFTVGDHNGFHTAYIEFCDCR